MITDRSARYVRRAYCAGRGLTLCLLISMVTPVCGDIQMAVQGVSGQPFGAGRVSLVLETDEELLAAATGGLKLADAEGRALYPAVAGDGAVRLLRRLAGGTDTWSPERFEIFFLFTGETPFDLQVTAAGTHTKRVVPANGPRLHRNMVNRWWREYRRSMQQQGEQGDYPPIAESYLTNMLAHRMGIVLPPKPLIFRRADPGREMWDLLTGAESLEQSMIATVIAGGGADEMANQPIPPPAPWKHAVAEPAVQIATDSTTKLEPLAAQVPANCFYIRFGKFSNFLWLSELTEEAGGDIGRMVTLRGIASDMTARLQGQLAIDDLPFAQLLGDKVIADVALIGRDLLFQQGAAVGVLIQESAPVVGPGIAQLRGATAKREAARGCRLETIPVGDTQVSLLSTPDNAIRSFHVTRGSYHLVTNCESMVESFLAIPETGESLANDGDFREMRQTLSGEREPTIFAFFPRKFFAGLASPEYQVELTRRMRSSVEIRAFSLAQRLYLHETRAGLGRDDASVAQLTDLSSVTLEQLVAQRLLPKGFGRRVDGSRLEIVGGHMVDSLRGGLGHFLPIPDAPIVGATSGELKACQAVSRFCAAGWDDWDPLAIALNRELDPRAPGRERLSFHARISPFNRAKYERWISILGPPSPQRSLPDPQNLLTVEAVVDGGRFMPAITEHHLLFCVRDVGELPEVHPGRLFGKLQMAQLAPAYLVSYPNLGLLRLIPTIAMAPDLGEGFSRLPFGCFRRDCDDYVALSFHPELLRLPKPEVVTSDRPAQLHIVLRDPSATGLTPWINAFVADRALRASLGNVRFLHSLEQQLGLPSDSVRTFAEELAGGRLTCSLGGDYELVGDKGGSMRWCSTAWSRSWPLELASPDTYRAPVVQYLRGFELQAALLDQHAELTGYVDFQRSVAARTKEPAPLFQLFGSGDHGFKVPNVKSLDRGAKPKD